MVIENQRRGERVVLAAEDYLRGLDEIVATLRGESGGAFRIARSMSSHLEVMRWSVRSESSVRSMKRRGWTG